MQERNLAESKPNHDKKLSRQVCPHLLLLFMIVVHTIKQDKETICRHIGKEAVKLILFSDGMIAETEKPKASGK